jgi:polysaccharide export outer membrane protein
MILSRCLFCLAIFLSVAGCGTSRSSSVPGGAQAYAVIPVKSGTAAEAQMIRAGDRLSIRVFGEPELTSDNYRVDAVGNVQMPLAGELLASGHSPASLRQEIVQRLAVRYIRDPQVSVTITESARAKVTIEGQVEEPGSYDVDSSSTLLTALAQAKSPSKTAKLDEILVFRTVDGQRMGARFDLREIRSGNAADPQILAGDTVVVGFSSAKGAWRDFLQAAPLISIFTLF